MVVVIVMVVVVMYNGLTSLVGLFRFRFRLKQTPLTHGSDRGCIRRAAIGP